MRDAREMVKIFVPLAALAYLGFYVYALIMSVFTPGEMPVLTAIAGACVAIILAVFVARRRGVEPVPSDSPRAREARAAREKRGF